MTIRKGIPLLVVFLFGCSYLSGNTSNIADITKIIDRIFEEFNT